MWKSKKQATTKTSIFGAEFVAMKHGMEMLCGLCYKLWMMDVPLSRPSYIYADNMSVIHYVQQPEFTLKKKSNKICYHAIHESVAMGEGKTSHILTNKNTAHLMTKIIMSCPNRAYLIDELLYDNYDMEQ